ncbi:hypothetical protein [Flagellimonas meridianipacifica]|uniref:Carboxypeptidase-like protein n=1 Tax=Flagellimonas meridianipacifica TaxID=1080225 RepID=A0A2T0M6D9_9FLAO|nr:hypothetical protein [Allomuricauda pacifica]PRX53059.1 hypothetical protein CLV81_3960 [Allomuricauda pacifica]
MRLKILPLLIFSITFGWAQNQRLVVILDAESKEPLEFVDVYNKMDHTTTNSDGTFFFMSELDSVVAYKVGYEKVRTTFEALRDTLYLKPSAFKLNEIILTNTKTLWDKVRDSIPKHYMFTPFKERFFLRCLLRKNGKMVRIQDIEGKLQRKTLIYRTGMESSKKDFSFEISNMRKIGTDKDENKVYFSFFSLSELLFETIRLNATGDGFSLVEKEYENQSKSKIFFQSDSSLVGLNTSGNYIIDNQSKAIEAFVMQSRIDRDRYFKNGPVRSRTVGVNQIVNFTRSPKWDKYFITSAKILYSVEITHTKKTFKDLYTCEYILQTFENNGSFSFNSNTNGEKDIFKLKHDYNPEFWENQNRLLLTKEMQDFINSFDSKKNPFKSKRKRKN